MKIVTISGNHQRHLYYINQVYKHIGISGSIIVHRENIIPVTPKDISTQDVNNYKRHFIDRKKTEQKYFGHQQIFSSVRQLLDPSELNTMKTVKFLKKIQPDVVLIFGTSLIKEPLYSTLPADSINLHLGISPRYRGSATLFWPFYFLEPTYAGSTFHYIISEPDAGSIIHQSVPQLNNNDGIHDVACKTVIQSSKDVLSLLKIFQHKKIWKKYKQKGTGKIFLQNDFKPQHLRVIYNLYNNNIVDEYLKGNLLSKKPNLIKQF